MANQETTSSAVSPCIGCMFLEQNCDDDCLLATLCSDVADNVSKLLTTLIPESNRINAIESLHTDENTSSVARPPCACCMFLEQICVPDCIFAPTFPQNNRQRLDEMVAKYGAIRVYALLLSLLVSGDIAYVKGLTEPQQNQQLQQNLKLYFPPDYTYSELIRQMELQGQQNQQQQGHSQAQPVLDQQPNRSQSDKGENSVPFSKDRGSQL